MKIDNRVDKTFQKHFILHLGDYWFNGKSGTNALSFSNIANTFRFVIDASKEHFTYFYFPTFILSFKDLNNSILYFILDNILFIRRTIRINTLCLEKSTQRVFKLNPEILPKQRQVSNNKKVKCTQHVASVKNN